MSVFQPGQIAYGFSQALIGVPIQTIVAQRVPSSNDKAPLGTFWIDTITNQVFVITSIVDNVAVWATVATGGSANQFNADTGTAFPSGGIINVFGGDNIVTSASGNTIDIATTGNINLPATNAAGTQGIYQIGGVNFGFMFPPTSVYVGNAGNTTNNPLLAINNVGVGNDALTLISTGNNNTALGTQALEATSTGTNNVGVGHLSLTALDSGDNNVAVGNLALESLDNGDENIAIGFSAGSNYTGSESDNILIGNQGVVGENNVMRLGTQGTGAGQQDVTFIAGIYGSTYGGTNQVVFINSLGKIGSSTGTDGQVIIGATAGNPIWNTLTAGTNVTITNTANNIEIAVPGLGTEVIDGDTGSASGPVLTFTAIATGASTTFSATGTVVTLNLEDASQNVIIGKTAGGGTATGNVGIGHNVFHDLVTGGDGNVGIGLDALDAITTGTENIAIGTGAGTNYTSTESSNILIGNAGTLGESNTIRIGTTGSGSGQQDACYIGGVNGVLTSTPSLMTLDSTSEQAGTGTPALFIRNSNVFFGPGSGIATVTGFNNIGLGTQATASVSTGDSNTGIGQGALFSVTTGTNNIGLGTSAGFPIDVGSENIMIGTATGQRLNTSAASYNIAIGQGALYSQTGGHNICIGNAAGSSSAGSDSSNIYIGNPGTTPESNIARIGRTGSGNDQITDCYIAGTVHADTGLNVTTGNLTVASGNVDITAGNIDFPATSSSSVGVIQQNSQPFLHSFGDPSNVFLGEQAGGAFTASNLANIGIGFQALHGLTSGIGNNAIGYQTLFGVTTGSTNTVVGNDSCAGLTTGSNNTAVGAECVINTAGSYNTYLGFTCGSAATAGTESSNIYIQNAGVSGENNTIRIGTQGSGNAQQDVCFIAGIFGVTVGVSGVPVVIDNTGNLGTVVSSRRYKENISDMDDASRPIMDLRPVTFNLKNDRTHSRKFGLIAEEVDEILPDLVAHNKEGDPETVKYQDLPVLLLNELQRQHNIIAELSRRLQRLEGRAKYESKD